MRDKIASENRRALIKKMRAEYNQIESEEFDTSELSKKFGVELKHPASKPGRHRAADVQARFGLIPLAWYLTLRGKQSIHSIAVGLKRSPKDPKAGTVNSYWSNAELLEDPNRAILFSNFLDGIKTTCYAKLHLLLEDGKEPAIMLYPVQPSHARNVPDELDEIRKEIRQMIGAATPKEKRRLSASLKTLDTHRNFFAHKERHLLMPLFALEIAQRLGVKKIILPPASEITFKASRASANTGRQSQVERNYEHITAILETGAKTAGIKVIQAKSWDDLEE